MTTPAGYETFRTEAAKLPKPRYSLSIVDLENDFVDKFDGYAAILGKQANPG